MIARFIAGLSAVVIFAQSSSAAEPASVSELRTTGKPIKLFNGKNLDGWDCRLVDKTTPMEKVWSVKDGLLLCTGKPSGYLLTKRRDFENYVLNVEWRWPGEGGNNGVFVRYSEKRGEVPKAIEVQLASGDAGDFWAGDGVKIDVENEGNRKSGQRYKNLTDDSENPVGEWNAMQVICRGDEMLVMINGNLVNHGTRCSERKGAIALQSEGTPIEFRKVELRKLAK
jgi:hypothetical protein